MTKLLTLSAILEAATGLALMIDPSLVVRLLLGEGVSGQALALGRVAGFGLFSLGLACWPVGNGTIVAPAFRALFSYNLLVTTYLLSLGIGGQWVGILLWPAATIHAIFTLLIAGAWIISWQNKIS